MNLNYRSLRHSQARMLMIIRLRHPSFPERDLLHHLAQAIDDGALDLVFSRTRIDDLAANVTSDPNLINFHLLVRADGDLGDLGKITAMAEVKCDAKCGAFGKLPLAPARFLRRELNDVAHSSRIQSHRPRPTASRPWSGRHSHSALEQVEPELHRVFAGGVREFIDK